MYSRSWKTRLGHGARRGAGRVILSLLVVAGLVAGGMVSCGEENALLLVIRAESLVDNYDLRVRDLESGEVVLERTSERVDPTDPNRDISKPGQELRVGVRFGRPGHYLIHIMGRASGQRFAAVRDFRIEGFREDSVLLKILTSTTDEDGDGFPACSAFTNCGVADNAFSCQYLDCDDTDADVNPFGVEVCGDGKDNDCDQGCNPKTSGDAECEDKDGDGVPAGKDCDDNDPCRSPEILEAANLCENGLESFKLPQACLDKLAAEGKSVPVGPFCGDGIDQSCSGGDLKCVVDEDCDRVSPPADCNDKDPKINPGATEVCGDSVDNNCNGNVDEGCLPCDVDGDGYAKTKTADCDVPEGDVDDFDRGRNPATTEGTGGKEGGDVKGALRGWCGRTLNKDGDAERDVDHDGDGKAAADDGCPEIACDEDGDGFERRGPGCVPSGEEDCDDTDAKVFPGAPDYCKDNIAQNCTAALSCTIQGQDRDKDDDGYVTPDDCNDSDPNVHPWAVEVCDGIDNDCDGLIDEGNPDDQGNLIGTGPSCTDDNDGKCGEVKGICICSPIKPKSSQDPSGNYMACAGEDLSAVASSRCFGAIQPQNEQCDDQDWDCDGRNDDPQGDGAIPLADLGKTCSVSVGSCVAGTVVGCDLTRTMPASQLAVVKAVQPEFNQHWVCSAGTELPLPDTGASLICNGKDDDCNGAMDDAERDDAGDGFDGDLYIACDGCTIGSTRRDLLATLKGCGDCEPQKSKIFPTQKEECDGVDNNCTSGISDDGDDVCTSSETCCWTNQSRGCFNLSNDTNHCGGCDTRCDEASMDRCHQGSCSCGTLGRPCGAGLDCVNGQCKCIEGGRCSGCCNASGQCEASTIDHCGIGGKACTKCEVDDADCEFPRCDGTGTCQKPDRPNETTTCASGNGRCWNGRCCEGCWDGDSCEAFGSGQSETKCGVKGTRCDPCALSSNPCKQRACLASGCGLSNKANISTTCTGGVCVEGTCCTGCRYGANPLLCEVLGSSMPDSRCNSGGAACRACSTVKGDSICDNAGRCVCPTDHCDDGTTCRRIGSSQPDTACGRSGSCVDCTSVRPGSQCNSAGQCACPIGTCYDAAGGRCVTSASQDTDHCINGVSNGGACTDCDASYPGATCNSGTCGCPNGTCNSGSACLDSVGQTRDNCINGVSNGGNCTDCDLGHAGAICDSGTCKCPDGHCDTGSACIAPTSQTKDACINGESGGGACTDCDNGLTGAQCVLGFCRCPDGTCRSGNTCITTGTQTTNACINGAVNGAACSDCDASLSGGVCRADGTCGCPDGTCRWGSTCVSPGGQNTNACINGVANGGACSDCDAALTGGQCVLGLCGCPNGTCRSGSTCFTSGTQTTNACINGAVNGAACSDCDATLTGGICRADGTCGCPDGTCRSGNTCVTSGSQTTNACINNVANGGACSDCDVSLTGGVCRADGTCGCPFGECQSGNACIDTGSQTKDACIDGEASGGPCTDCDSGLPGGDCVFGVCNCPDGTCRSGSTCISSGGQSTNACINGVPNGGACTDCDATLLGGVCRTDGTCGCPDGTCRSGSTCVTFGSQTTNTCIDGEANGGLCTDCDASLSGGVCRADGTCGCPLGECQSGSVCIDSASQTKDACINGEGNGGACSDCDDGIPGGKCRANGMCGCDDGKCLSGSSCIGSAGQTDEACLDGELTGGACTDCTLTSEVCSSDVCGPP